MNRQEFDALIEEAQIEEARAKVYRTEVAWLNRPKDEENGRLAVDSILAEDELRDLLMVQQGIGIEEARRQVVELLLEIRKDES